MQPNGCVSQTLADSTDSPFPPIRPICFTTVPPPKKERPKWAVDLLLSPRLTPPGPLLDPPPGFPPETFLDPSWTPPSTTRKRISTRPKPYSFTTVPSRKKHPWQHSCAPQGNPVCCPMASSRPPAPTGSTLHHQCTAVTQLLFLPPCLLWVY